MFLVLTLILVLSVTCNWAVWQMLRDPASKIGRVPFIIADVPDMSLDWRGLI